MIKEIESEEWSPQKILQLKQLERRSLKKSGLQRDAHRSKFSNLSNWKGESWKNQGFNGIRAGDLLNTGKIGLAPNVWLHSSVDGVSHRYRGGHGFEFRWSPDFFQASPFQLLKLENLLRRSFFFHFQKPHVLFWFLTSLLLQYFISD